MLEDNNIKRTRTNRDLILFAVVAAIISGFLASNLTLYINEGSQSSIYNHVLSMERRLDLQEVALINLNSQLETTRK